MLYVGGHWDNGTKNCKLVRNVRFGTTPLALSANPKALSHFGGETLNDEFQQISPVSNAILTNIEESPLMHMQYST